MLFHNPSISGDRSETIKRFIQCRGLVLTDGFGVSFHLLLGQTERSTIVEMQGHLSLNMQNNAGRLMTELARYMGLENEDEY